MTFDVTGLLIFLLAIVPGFLAEQARHSIIPRSLQNKSTIEETGEYVIDSLFIHFFFLTAFRVLLSWVNPSTLDAFGQAATQKKLPGWAWEHRYLVLSYFVLSLIGGFFFGLLRGVLALNQPVRRKLGGFGWFSRLLENLGLYSFLQTDPVWYGVLRQASKDELTFVQVRMKGSGGSYSGELKSYGILEDSKREKDFYLVNVYFTKRDEDPYKRLDSDGVLLNFADVDSIEVTKRPRDLV
jgi:hypothetical protein